MDSGLIARRYASALLMYARKHGVEKPIYASAQAVARNFAQYPALRDILGNPLMSHRKKTDILCALATPEKSSEFRRFAELVTENDRIDLMQMICLSYVELCRQEQHILEVELTTAVPISEETRSRIATKIAQITGKTIEMTTQTDPALIGGFAVRWDTYRWDASVVSELRRIRKSLTATANN